MSELIEPVQIMSVQQQKRLNADRKMCIIVEILAMIILTLIIELFCGVFNKVLSLVNIKL